jgi:hypothetical protein
VRFIVAALAVAALCHINAVDAAQPEAHVPTAAYCCHGYANDTVAPEAAAPFLTWAANPDHAGADADRAAGIENIYTYVDVSRVYKGDHQYPAVESGKFAALRARNCSGGLVMATSPSGYVTDPFNPLWSRLLEEELTYNAYPAFNAYFVDDIDVFRWQIENGPPCSGDPPRPWTEPATAAAYASHLGAARATIIFNGLSAYTDKPELHAVPLVLFREPNVIGGMCEECYAGNNPDQLKNGVEWQDALDLQIRTIRLHKIFWLYARYIANDPAARMYTFASYMLAWDPRYSVYQTAYAPENRGQLKVTPETGLVAHEPLGGEVSSVYQLRDSGGTFVREYRRCYYRRKPIGGCAFVVNNDRFLPRLRPRLRARYEHVLVVHGGMVLEGGAVSFDGRGVPGTIPPLSGFVLTR